MQNPTIRNVAKISIAVLTVSLIATTEAFATADEDCYEAVIRGRQLVAKNDLVGALQTFRTAQRIQPVDSRPYFWIGYCLERSGDLNGAVKAYADCLNSAKMHGMDSAELRVDLGNTLCRLNYYKEAIFDYKRALVIDPSLTVAHIGLLRTYIETKDWPAANREFDYCTTHSITSPEIDYLRALALTAQGAKAEALAQIQTFISSNQRTLQNTAVMEKARALEAELKRP
ncbi:MAG: tetratricopeptide repeat protein [Candidatus Melainabacteria bacterium]|nr:MAG: tetratricopeptide repeat protein [Candidatus Melainabacteria bacterium]